MKNFDQIKQERELILAAMMTAMKADDKDAFSQAFAQLVSSATEEVKAEFELSTRTADAGILHLTSMFWKASRSRSNKPSSKLG